MKKRILLIEDDPESIEFSTIYLEKIGFSVTASESALTALTLLYHYRFDLVILDINLPDFNGFEVCSKIRNESAIPIIFVSAWTDEESHIRAFKLGADDYLTKPVNLELLSLHIWAILRRTSAIPKIENLTASFINDTKHRRIFHKGETLALTAIEYQLLALLIENQGKTLNRDTLIKALSSDADMRSLDYHIKNLRKKLGDTGKNPAKIKTDYGIGYRLESD